MPHAAMTIDEFVTAAGETFDSLDTEHTGALTYTQIRSKYTKADFTRANTTKDAVITRDEYTADAQRRATMADADADGTVSETEFDQPAGIMLLRML